MFCYFALYIGDFLNVRLRYPSLFAGRLRLGDTKSLINVMAERPKADLIKQISNYYWDRYIFMSQLNL